MRLMSSATYSGPVLQGAMKVGLIMVVVGMLGGCISGSMSDLQDFVRKEKAKEPGRMTPIPEFSSYEVFHYAAGDLRDPFKAFEEEAQIIAAPVGGIPGPDLQRNRETLEQFPLDTLRFVGHLEKDGERWAIVTSPDAMVHRVKVGNYLGVNFGKIVRVTENSLLISEVIPDGRGGWIDRDAALSLID